MPQLERLALGDVPPPNEHAKNLERALDSFCNSVRTLINKGLRPSDNFDAFEISITTNATPGVETAIAHGLKRVPSGYWVVKRNKAAHIYDGGTAWTSENIYVRSDVATVTARIIVF